LSKLTGPIPLYGSAGSYTYEMLDLVDWAGFHHQTQSESIGRERGARWRLGAFWQGDGATCDRLAIFPESPCGARHHGLAHWAAADKNHYSIVSGKGAKKANDYYARARVGRHL